MTRITTDDNGGGTDNNAWLVAVLPRNGVYRVKARSYQHQTIGAYRIRLRMENPPNYALSFLDPCRSITSVFIRGLFVMKPQIVTDG